MDQLSYEKSSIIFKEMITERKIRALEKIKQDILNLDDAKIKRLIEQEDIINLLIGFQGALDKVEGYNNA